MSNKKFNIIITILWVVWFIILLALEGPTESWWTGTGVFLWCLLIALAIFYRGK